MAEDRADRFGLFIVFEGVEGAGKSTHIAWLGERLREAGVPSRVVREPGGTPAAERVREIVLDPEFEISPEMELLLILAARAELVRRVVGPALERGEVVLGDRYEMSTFAYQGVGRGLGLEAVRRLNRFATGGLRPDAVILLDVGAEEGLGRKRGGADDAHALDRLELEGREFLSRVEEAYVDLAQQDPTVVRVDSRGPVEEVQTRISLELAARFPETFGLIPGLRD